MNCLYKFFKQISSGNRTPGSRFYSDLLDISVNIYQLVLKRCSSVRLLAYYCRRLTCGSFQLTHMSCDDHAVQLTEPWWPKRGRTLLQRSQRCHNGEFRHVSISTRPRSLRCGQNLRGPFLRATLLMRVGSCARVMRTREDKRSHNSTTKVSFCTIIIGFCHCMIAITRV